MGGTIQYISPAGSLAGDKSNVGVYRNIGGGWAFLPNVRCLSVHQVEGADPGRARFRYAFDPFFDPEDPVRFEDVIPLSARDPNVVRNDDRIGVATYDGFGNPVWLFDGFAKIPEGMLNNQTELVTFWAIGVAERLWDTSIDGSIWRDASNVGGGSDQAVQIPARFNPDGAGNAVAGTSQDPNANDLVLGSGFQLPTFLDPDAIASRSTYYSDGIYYDTQSDGSPVGRKWTLEMAARYLIGTGNPSEVWVLNPDWTDVAALLVSVEPGNDGNIDPLAFDFQVKPISIREITLQGRKWPNVLEELIRPHGYGMKFQLSTVGGQPQTVLRLWRKQFGDNLRYKRFYLQAAGSPLDPNLSNIAQADVARQGNKLANEIAVETDLQEFEASFVLAPGWQIGDGDLSNKAAFRSDNPAYRQGGDNFNKYRTWVFDETGDGHWDLDDDVWVTGTPTDLRPVLGQSNQGNPLYVPRRRPGKDTLLSTDDTGKPLRRTLSISFDYEGKIPGVWDGSGTWQPIKGEFVLLRDRLGIHVECLDPNDWKRGGIGTQSGIAGSPDVRSVDWLGTIPPTQFFVLRLTTVIEGDLRGNAVATKRPASPTPYTINQTVDAKDRYKSRWISYFSEFNPNPGDPSEADTAVRDDTPEAMDEAEDRRRASEVPPLTGTFTIPYLSLGYRVGDRITYLAGRNASFQTNAATQQGESPIYPEVIGIDWHMDGPQSTVVHISDEAVLEHHSPSRGLRGTSHQDGLPRRRLGYQGVRPRS